MATSGDTPEAPFTWSGLAGPSDQVRPGRGRTAPSGLISRGAAAFMARVKYTWVKVVRALGAGLFAVVASGCAVSTTTAGPALVHPSLPYATAYEDTKTKSVLGDDWILENYRTASTASDGTATLERKEGYTLDYELDFDNDDKTDMSVTLPMPDLLFLSRRTNARIEVSTVLLDQRLGDKELQNLLESLLAAQTGSRARIVAAGKREAISVQKRYASRAVEVSEASLGPHKGLVATVERADLDQVELDANARSRRSRLFLLRAPFDYYAVESQIFTTDGAPSKPPKTHRYRVLLIVDYENSAAEFDAQYPDFVKLMNKLHVLTDDMLLDLLTEELAKCSSGTPAQVALDIGPDGIASFGERSGFIPECPAFASSYPFPATGSERHVTRKYDFSKPRRPAWLDQGSFSEQRAAPTGAPAPTPADPPAPEVPASPPASEPAPVTSKP